MARDLSAKPIEISVPRHSPPSPEMAPLTPAQQHAARSAMARISLLMAQGPERYAINRRYAPPLLQRVGIVVGKTPAGDEILDYPERIVKPVQEQVEDLKAWAARQGLPEQPPF